MFVPKAKAKAKSLAAKEDLFEAASEIKVERLLTDNKPSAATIEVYGYIEKYGKAVKLGSFVGNGEQEINITVGNFNGIYIVDSPRGD